MASFRVVIAHLFLFALLLPGATTYSIEALRDPNQSGDQFSMYFPGGMAPWYTNTSHLRGYVGSSAAIGTLSGGQLITTTLNALPGGDGAWVTATLQDGSAIGHSYDLVPSPVYTLVHWKNGVASELNIVDPFDSTGVFQPVNAVNAAGDIVGNIERNGALVLYQYNVFSKEFSYIAPPASGPTGTGILGVTDDRKALLAAGNKLQVYDLDSKTWTEISIPDGYSSGSNAIMNTAGSIAFTMKDALTGDDAVAEYRNGVIYILTPQPQPFSSKVRIVLGYNSSGLIAASENSRMLIFENGVSYDLFPQITNSAGWTPFATSHSFVTAVANDGRIFGMGLYNNESTLFVLTPTSDVPEPATGLLTFAALSLGGFTLRRAAKRKA